MSDDKDFAEGVANSGEHVSAEDIDKQSGIGHATVGDPADPDEAPTDENIADGSGGERHPTG